LTLNPDCCTNVVIIWYCNILISYYRKTNELITDNKFGLISIILWIYSVCIFIKTVVLRLKSQTNIVLRTMVIIVFFIEFKHVLRYCRENYSSASHMANSRVFYMLWTKYILLLYMCDVANRHTRMN